MSPSDWIRAGALYFPLVLALLAGLTLGRRPRVFAACLLSVLWSSCTLLLLQRVNLWTRWWTFSGEGATLLRMPLELYFGWIILWGVLPQLVFRLVPIALSAALMIAVDAVAMPICSPVVLLGPRWLLGEAVAAFAALIPALLIARWTMKDSHLRARAAMQVASAGILFLYLLPEITFALRPGEGWTPLLQMSSWRPTTCPAVSLHPGFARGHGGGRVCRTRSRNPDPLRSAKAPCHQRNLSLLRQPHANIMPPGHGHVGVPVAEWLAIFRRGDFLRLLRRHC